MKVTPEMTIGELIRLDENIVPILMRAGMHCIGCPSAQGESLAEAAMVHGINGDMLVARSTIIWKINNFCHMPGKIVCPVVCGNKKAPGSFPRGLLHPRKQTS